MYYPPPKKAFDYGDLITGALHLVWRYKFLWFFGIFAGTGTSLGGWNFNFSSGDFSEEEIPQQVTDWVETHLALILSLVAAAVIIALLLWLWSIVCKGAVIQTVRDIRAGASVSFGGAFRHGRKSFGRLLLLYLLIFVISIGILIIVGAVITLMVFLAASGSAGEAIVGFLAGMLSLLVIALLITSFGYLAICTIWIVLPLLFTMVMLYSIRASVLEGLSPVAAIKRGFRVLLDNLTRSLFLLLISTGLSIAGVICIGFIALIASIPALVGWILAYTTGFTAPIIVVASLLSLPLLAAVVAGAAFFNTYFTVYWTDIYLKLTETGEAEPVAGNAV